MSAFKKRNEEEVRGTFQPTHDQQLEFQQAMLWLVAISFGMASNLKTVQDDRRQVVSSRRSSCANYGKMELDVGRIRKGGLCYVSITKKP